MTAITAFLGKLIRNKWFWYGLLLLLVILMVSKYWNDIKAFFKRDRGHYENDPSLTAERKLELEQLARDAFAKMDGWVQTPGEIQALDDLNGLNDTELRYTARFFKSISSDGDTLKNWVDDEVLPYTNVDEQLVARLSQMAL